MHFWNKMHIFAILTTKLCFYEEDFYSILRCITDNCCFCTGCRNICSRQCGIRCHKWNNSRPQRTYRWIDCYWTDSSFRSCKRRKNLQRNFSGRRSYQMVRPDKTCSSWGRNRTERNSYLLKRRFGWSCSSWNPHNSWPLCTCLQRRFEQCCCSCRCNRYSGKLFRTQLLND